MDMRWAPLLLLLLALAAADVEAEDTPARRSFALHPFAVVDPDRGVIYVGARRAAGGLVSARATGGRMLWTTDKAIRPIAVAGSRLVAQGAADAGDPKLVLVSLDTTDPDKEPRSATLALPSGVAPLVDDRLGETFRIEGFEHDGRVILHWTYTKQVVSGMRVRDPKVTRIEGHASFDPATGAVKALGKDAPPKPMTRMPAPVAAASQRLRIWAAGDTWISISRSEPGKNRQINVRRWNARGEPLPRRAFQVKDWLVELASEDGRHLLAVTRREGGRPMFDDYQWTIFDLATGKQTATHVKGRSAAPFAVIDGVVVHVAPPHARREDGKLVRHPLRLVGQYADGHWSLPIRDTRYRGPMPPGRR